MKKTLVVFLTVLLSVLLFSVDHMQKTEPFSVFYKNQTNENFSNAFDYYNDILKKYPDNADAKIKLVYMFSILKHKYTNQLKADLDSLSIREKFQLANILLDSGNYDDALKIYDELNKKVPKWSCPWRHKGEAYFKMKKYQQAEDALKKAIEIRKEHYDAYIMLADVQKNMGKYKEALKTFETGLSYKGKDIENPENEVNFTDELFLQLELLKLNNKDYTEILKKLKKIVPDDPRLKKYE